MREALAPEDRRLIAMTTLKTDDTTTTLTIQKWSSSFSTPRPATSTTASSRRGYDFYRKDAEYWMPSWDDNDRLVEDPQRDISLI